MQASKYGENEIVEELSDDGFYFEYNCSSLLISLQNEISIKCGNTLTLQIPYELIQYHRFYVSNDVEIYNYTSQDNENYILQIINTITPIDKIGFTFKYILNLSLIDRAIFNLPKTNIKILLDWNKLVMENPHCPWDNNTYYPEYNDFKFYIDDLIKNSKWQKICISQDAYLYYDNQQKVEIKYISLPTALVVFIIVVAVFIALVISLYFIAYHFFNKDQDFNDDTSADEVA